MVKDIQVLEKVHQRATIWKQYLPTETANSGYSLFGTSS